MSLYKQIKFDNKGGRPPAFKTPEDMLSKALEYFQWCEDNPLPETKVFNSQGEIISGEVPHMRAMTQAGLCIFLNIGVSSWHDYKKKPKFSEVTSMIEQIMFEQKFTGAASGMLKENIIARDLGLAEKQEQKSVIHNIMPVPVATSVEDWEKAAQRQQEESLNHSND